MILKGGQVLQFGMVNGFQQADILVQDSKIIAIGQNIELNGQDTVVDVSGKYITPGLIDAHSHILISEEGGGKVGDDCCDYSNTATPELDALDALYPFDRAVKDCVKAGVTTTCVTPGSDGVVGGCGAVIQLCGSRADEMIVTRKAAMKCSVGENPKQAAYSFCSRMGVGYQLRKCFEDAIDYRIRKEAAQQSGTYFRKDLGMENMLLVLDKKIPVHMHAHRSDDICTAIRIAEEYQFDMVIIHGTDSVAIVDYLAQFNFPVVVGPLMNSRSKPETANKSYATPGILAKAGIKVSICSDHDVTPMYFLPVYAALAVQYGMDEIDAFKAVTINPAETLRIDDRKGELSVSMDADIVIWNGHPLDFRTQTHQVYIEGILQYTQER
jgi:imidazolonepropionase-like amidohydrolase